MRSSGKDKENITQWFFTTWPWSKNSTFDFSDALLSCVHCRFTVHHADGYGSFVDGAWNGMVGMVVRQVWRVEWGGVGWRGVG